MLHQQRGNCWYITETKKCWADKRSVVACLCSLCEVLGSALNNAEERGRRSGVGREGRRNKGEKEK